MAFFIKPINDKDYGQRLIFLAMAFGSCAALPYHLLWVIRCLLKKIVYLRIINSLS